MPQTFNREILEAALHGLEVKRGKLDEQIAQVRSLIGGGSSQGAIKSVSDAPMINWAQKTPCFEYCGPQADRCSSGSVGLRSKGVGDSFT